MGAKLISTKYYLKKNGKVNIITKEEYEEFINKMKSEGKKYQCSDCKICDCEKIKYTNIYNCEEVELAIFVRKKYQFIGENMVKNTIDNTFTVFECNRFEPFREIILKEQNNTKDQILELEKQIVSLEDQTREKVNKKKQQELNELKEQRKQLMRLITEKSVLDKLKRQQKNIREQYTYEKVKKLSLENKEK